VAFAISPHLVSQPGAVAMMDSARAAVAVFRWQAILVLMTPPSANT